MDMVGYLNNAQDVVRNLRGTRLGSLRHPAEFFDWQRVSLPKDFGEFLKRAGYNLQYFSANYLCLFAVIAVWFIFTNVYLLLAIVFLFGGYYVLSKFVTEPIEFQGKTITPQNLYTVYLVVGVILVWCAAPLSTFFGLVGSSGSIIAAHAGLLEPGVESEYAGVESV